MSRRSYEVQKFGTSLLLVTIILLLVTLLPDDISTAFRILIWITTILGFITSNTLLKMRE